MDENNLGRIADALEVISDGTRRTKQANHSNRRRNS